MTNGMDAPTFNGIEMCQSGDSISSTSTDRSVRYEGYNSRHRSGKESLPIARCERVWEGRFQEAITPRPEGRVLRESACLPYWHGSLRQGSVRISVREADWMLAEA